MTDATSDAAWLAALLETEAALAAAQARLGLIPAAAADAIAGACGTLELDPATIGREAAATGTPVVPLIAAVRDAVGPEAADHVHHGATSQDIVDTASMLVARRSLDLVLADLGRAADAAAGLAAEHRDTPISGRTLLQQAQPTTFGLKAAAWMSGLDDAGDGLRAVRDRRLAVQLGGAVGTLAAFGSDGAELVRVFAEELDLAVPILAWHTQRNRVGELAGALGVAAGAVAKPARDIVLLAQTEIGEVREGAPGRGGSSAMPHKRNPVAAVSAIAAAQAAPGLVATLLAAGVHEHERAAGAWHAEWLPLRQLLVAVGSAAVWLADALEHLVVDPDAMRDNLTRSGGLLLGERIVNALTPVIGRGAARELFGSVAAESAGTGRPFDELFRARIAGESGFAGIEADELLDPRGYLGSAGALVDAALAAHAARAGQGIDR